MEAAGIESAQLQVPTDLQLAVVLEVPTTCQRLERVEQEVVHGGLSMVVRWRRRLKNIVVSNKLQLLVVCETHVHVSRAEEYRIRLGFDCVRTHSSGLSWVFYNFPIVCSVATEGDQFLSLEICHPHLLAPITFAAVHAASMVEERKVLWDGLLHCQPHQRPWIVVRDFNVVLQPWEKRGGRPFRVAEASDFVEFMGSASLFDGGFSGSNFTWCNNRHGRAIIWKQLDRLLLNAADHEEFLGVVKQSWEQKCMGPPLHVLCSKLQRLRTSIQAWNKERVGNFFDNVRKVEAEVASLEQCMAGGGSDNDQLRLHQAQARLRRALAMEEAL
ncbi:uncharacterized protein LOC113780598 [Coffea eugenioides]|uniref:uncharacterized protein LOC113780598 n=1 Tax=Coffea eugenioides TaxID=49369 RepID=UPI000F613471|nr:uncharacterized protein LOC113780598 [Coffea eugenioides]